MLMNLYKERPLSFTWRIGSLRPIAAVVKNANARIDTRKEQVGSRKISSEGEAGRLLALTS